MSVYLDDGDVVLHHGDAGTVLATLPAESVDCVVTSPPYFGLRDYSGMATWEGGDPSCDHSRQSATSRASSGLEGATATQGGAVAWKGRCGRCGAVRHDFQIGLEDTPAAFVARLVEVFREVRRVLAPHGVCWVNMGDSYASSSPTGHGGWDGNNKNPDGSPRSNRQAGASWSRVPTAGPWAKPKDLLGIPWMLAQALQAPYYTGRIRSEADRAYLAGFLDGEGTISFVERDRGPNHTATHDARVFITNCDDGLLRHFAAMTAGRVYQHESGERENRYGSRPCFRWQMGTHDSALLLRELYPYLRGKRRQAALIWTLYTTLRHNNGHARTPAGIVSRRREIADMVRRLNRGEDVSLPPWVEAPPPAEEPGWWLRSDVIWSKPNPMPESVTDRPTKAHEYLFLLTKAPRYYWDAEGVREPNEHPHRSGTNPRLASVTQPGNTFQGRDGRSIDSNPSGRNVRTVWTFPTEPNPEAHFATFPRELVRRCLAAGCPERVCATCGEPSRRIVEVTAPDGTKAIRGARFARREDGAPLTGDRRIDIGVRAAWSAENGVLPTAATAGWTDCGHGAYRPGIVLDPFMGSGTTAVVARAMGRHAVGIDGSAEYLEIARRRTQQLSLLGGAA